MEIAGVRKKHKSKRSTFFFLLILASIMLVILDRYIFGVRSLTIIAGVLSPLYLIIWKYFGTYYIIEEGKVIYKSGFWKGEIFINQINEVVENKTVLIGVKAGFGLQGLLIKYNKYDELYITPEDNEAFIMDLQKENDQIKVNSL